MLSVGGGDDDDSSVSSVSTQGTAADESSLRNLVTMGHRRSGSAQRSPRGSADYGKTVSLYREEQRVSLRAWLRKLLQNQQVAGTKAVLEFLTSKPIRLNQEELEDIERRKGMDEKRITEQRQFYEIARQRARELDVYMERFRRDIVERSKPCSVADLAKSILRPLSDGLTNLFKEIREKQTINDLSTEYKKFAEWLRIE